MKASHWFLLAGMVCVAAVVVMLAVTGPGVAVGVPLSLQLLGWLESDLEPGQVELLAGLAVFPLVALMTASAALRANLKTLAERHTSAQLPNGVTSMGEFKAIVGFEELEAMQGRFLVGRDA